MAHIVPQISLFLPNKPGVMAQVAEALAKKKVNILGISISESTHWGVFRFVVDKAGFARQALSKLGKGRMLITPVIEVMLPNVPGQLLKISNRLARARIRIDYAYATGTKKGNAVLYISVSDPEKAVKLLK